MIVIGLATCLLNAWTLVVGYRFFTACGSARTVDKHLVAALMGAAFFFPVVYAVALATDPVHIQEHHPASALWAGFYFYVSMLHLAIIHMVARIRLARACEVTQ